jgi:hypothetical protein
MLGNTVLHVDMGTQVGFREVSTQVTLHKKYYTLIML